MAKQHPKQLSLVGECFGESDFFGYAEQVVLRTKEEGELRAYIENVGFEPRNLPPDHPAYKLWTWKTKRDGNPIELIETYNKTLESVVK